MSQPTNRRLVTEATLTPALEKVEAARAEVETARTEMVTVATEASTAASQAQATSDALVPRVAQIETMAGLAPGEVTDAQTANLITRQDTETRDALNAANVQAAEKGGPVRAMLDQVYPRVVTPEMFGGEDHMVQADSTEAIRQALATGGKVELAAGKTYACPGEPLVVQPGMHIVGTSRSGAGRSRIRTTNGDLFATGGTAVYNVKMDNLVLDAFGTGAGDIFTGLWSLSKLDNVAVTQYRDDKHAFNVTGWIDMSMDGCSVTHTTSATVPTFKGVTSVGEIAQVNFGNTRFTHTGDYAIWLEGQNGSVIIGVDLTNINFEISEGGAVKLLSARNVLISTPGMWDFHTRAAHKHLIYIGKSPVVGALSRDIKIENMVRDASIPPLDGIYDIYVEQDSMDGGLEIAHSGHQTDGDFKVYAGNVPGRVVGGRVTHLDAGSRMATEGAWHAYTPSLAGAGTTAGNATGTGAFSRSGHTINFHARVVLGTETVIGSQLFVSLPTPAASYTSYTTMECLGEDTGVEFYRLGADVDPGVTHARARIIGSNGVMRYVTATTPFTWEAGDAIQIRGTYEAAA